MQKKWLEVLRENRFELLEDVKTVNIGNEMAVTLSIGIGLDADTYLQNYDYARNAIDLALGRGGDQAVIKTPDDLKGLKFRTPPDPATIDIFQALGAATVQIAFAELYVALQQKVVDGQENPLTNIASSKIYEVNPFISLSAHKWECNPVLMSKMAWNRLDAKQKEIVMEAMSEATALQIKTSDEANIKLATDFRANKSLTITEVDLNAFRKQTASVFDKWEQKPFGAFVKDLRKTVLG